MISVRRMWSALAACLLPGCATLTVDVDVYKGSLVNSDKVQTEQIVALAMGAKPILVELRNRLERQACFDLHTKGKVLTQQSIDGFDREVLMRKSLEECPDLYKMLYEVGAKSIDGFKVVGSDAKRVNEILSLYQTTPSRLPPEVERRVRSFVRYTEQRTESMRVPVKAPKEAAEQTTPQAIWKRFSEQLKSNAGEINKLPDATLDLLRKDPEAKDPSTVSSIRSMIPRDVMIAFQELYPQGAATADIFQESLSLLMEKPLAEVSSDQVIRQSLVEMVTMLWSPEATRRLLERKKSLVRLSDTDPIVTFARRNQTLGGDNPLRPDEQKKLRDKMAQDLLSAVHGAGLTEALLSTQRQLRSDPYLGPWGLAVVPDPRQDSGFLSAEALAAKLEPIKASLNDRIENSLARGRTEKGLDELTENLLKALEHDRRTHSEQTRDKHEAEEDVLMDTLVIFGQKVVTIANNDPLLKHSQDETTRTYVTVLQAVGNSILNQVDEREKKHKHRKDLQARKELHEQVVRAAQQATMRNTMSQLNSWALMQKQQKDSGADVVLVSDLGHLLGSVQSADPQISGIRDWLEAEAQTQQNALTESRTKLIRYTAGRQRFESAETEKALGAIAIVVGLDGFRDIASTALPGSHGVEMMALLRDIENDLKSFATADAQTWRTRCVDTLKSKEVALQAEVQRREQLHAQVSNWSAHLSSTVAMLAYGTDKNAPIGLQATYELLAENLRLQHINAIARGDKIEAERLQNAINQTDTYRSGKLYIRPSVAFLRNSYPATELQGDASTLWSNMLDDQAVRSLPSYDKARKSIVQNSIDKQYWQNINTIRVSGTGNTNYAVTKDDVGNWYVKGYANNTDKMIQSFKNVALFSLGGGVRSSLASAAVPLPVDAAAGDKAAAAARTAVTPGAKSVLEKQYDSYTKSYRNKLLALYRVLKQRMLISTDFSDALWTAGLVGLKDDGVRDKAQSGKQPDQVKLLSSLQKSAGYVANQSELERMSREGADGEDKLDVPALRKGIDLLLGTAADYRTERRKAILASAKPADSTNWLDKEAADQFAAGMSAGATDFIVQAADKALKAGEDYESSLLVLQESAGASSSK